MQIGTVLHEDAHALVAILTGRMIRCVNMDQGHERRTTIVPNSGCRFSGAAFTSSGLLGRLRLAAVAGEVCGQGSSPSVTAVRGADGLELQCLLETYRPHHISSLIQEWRGDYVGMVPYLDDQQCTWARRLPRTGCMQPG